MMNIRVSGTSSPSALPMVTCVPFRFDGPSGCVSGRLSRQAAGSGDVGRLAPGNAQTLAARVADALAELGPDGLIGGALPFDPMAQDCLWRGTRDNAPAPATIASPDLPPPDWRLSPQPEPGHFADAVAEALGIMARESGTPDALRKVVLARSLLVQAAGDIPVDALMTRLRRDPSTTAFQVALPQGRTLCGATPELLLEKTGAQIRSHPLAGSAARLADPALDRAAAQALASSDKDHREHALVVEAILDALSPWCRQLGCPEGTTVSSTRSIWHLGTRIQGVLRDRDTPSVVLASALHPTPAVCGVPAHRAAALIAALEPVARDFYAGAVGWCDAQGDGAWYVAIRCAEIAGNRARLYAGAGIVPGSDPQSETAETGAKFGALLSALGLPADAGLASGPQTKDDR